jgi:hypothetical protein
MMAKTKKTKGKTLAQTLDRHVLYEEAVQAVDFDLDFFERTYRAYRKKKFTTLREDFCGTAALATDWVRRNNNHKAWGVDLDRPTLDWGLAHHVAQLKPPAQNRLKLIEGNVLSAKTPPTEVTVAFNFSYWIFMTREELLTYFKKVYKDLAPTGLFFMDAFGGQDAMGNKKDKRKIPKVVRSDGNKIPKYTYIWDQAHYNVINHHITCHIHFRFSDGSRIDKAFTYHWRLWTLPEIRELLAEAGFSESHVYLHGWDEDGESDEIYRRRTDYKNELSWVGYVVAVK